MNVKDTIEAYPNPRAWESARHVLDLLAPDNAYIEAGSYRAALYEDALGYFDKIQNDQLLEPSRVHERLAKVAVVSRNGEVIKETFPYLEPDDEFNLLTDLVDLTAPGYAARPLVSVQEFVGLSMDAEDKAEDQLTLLQPESSEAIAIRLARTNFRLNRDLRFGQLLDPTMDIPTQQAIIRHRVGIARKDLLDHLAFLPPALKEPGTIGEYFKIQFDAICGKTGNFESMVSRDAEYYIYKAKAVGLMHEDIDRWSELGLSAREAAVIFAVNGSLDARKWLLAGDTAPLPELFAGDEAALLALQLTDVELWRDTLVTPDNSEGILNRIESLSAVNRPEFANPIRRAYAEVHKDFAVRGTADDVQKRAKSDRPLFTALLLANSSAWVEPMRDEMKRVFEYSETANALRLQSSRFEERHNTDELLTRRTVEDEYEAMMLAWCGLELPRVDAMTEFRHVLSTAELIADSPFEKPSVYKAMLGVLDNEWSYVMSRKSLDRATQNISQVVAGWREELVSKVRQVPETISVSSRYL